MEQMICSLLKFIQKKIDESSSSNERKKMLTKLKIWRSFSRGEISCFQYLILRTIYVTTEVTQTHYDQGKSRYL
jgi:hypothetical protein